MKYYSPADVYKMLQKVFNLILILHTCVSIALILPNSEIIL